MPDPLRGFRIRMSTLMLLVVIAALVLAVAVQEWRRNLAERRLESELVRANAAMTQARIEAELARVRAEESLRKAREISAKRKD